LPVYDEELLLQVELKEGLLALPVPQEKPTASQQVLADRGERLAPVLQGLASWYGGSDGFDGLPTASGEIFNAADLTAAHRTLHFGTRVRVTYLRTGKSVVVRINDRGPFTGGRIIDLSRAAAEAIGLLADGVGLVELEILD
jgi:rare lipoprotein A